MSNKNNDIDFDFLDISDIDITPKSNHKNEEIYKQVKEKVAIEKEEIKENNIQENAPQADNDAWRKYVEKRILIERFKNGSFVQDLKKEEEKQTEEVIDKSWENNNQFIENLNEIKVDDFIDKSWENNQFIENLDELKIDDLIENKTIEDTLIAEETMPDNNSIEDINTNTNPTNETDIKKIPENDLIGDININPTIEDINTNSTNETNIQDNWELIKEEQEQVETKIEHKEENILNVNSKQEMDNKNLKVFGIDLWKIFNKVFSKKPKEEVSIPNTVVNSVSTEEVNKNVKETLVKEVAVQEIMKNNKWGKPLIVWVVAFILGVGVVYGAVSFVPEIASVLAQPAIEKAVEENTKNYENQISELKAENEKVEEGEKAKEEVEKLKTDVESYKQDILNEKEKVEKYQKYLIILNNSTKENMESLFNEIENNPSGMDIKVIKPAEDKKETSNDAMNADATNVSLKKDNTSETKENTNKEVKEEIKNETKEEVKKEIKAPNLSNLKKTLNKEKTTIAETKKVAPVAIPWRAEQVGEINAGEITTNNQ